VRCSNRALAGASAALDALIGVDNVFGIAFADSTDGANFCTSAAHDAIVTDFVCHSKKTSFSDLISFYHIFQKNQYCKEFFTENSLRAERHSLAAKLPFIRIITHLI